MTKMQQNGLQGSQLIILSLEKHYTEGKTPFVMQMVLGTISVVRNLNFSFTKEFF